jgi:hypothetical protein
MIRKTQLESTPVIHKNITLNADQKATLNRHNKYLAEGVNELDKMIKAGTLDLDYASTILGLGNNIIRLIHVELGLEGLLDQKLEDAYATCRKFSDEITDLRAEMAKGVTPESLGAKLYELQQIIYKWWTEEMGFSYCDCKVSCGSKGGNFLVEFSTSPKRHVFTGSTTPVTDQEKLDAKLEEMQKQFQIVENPHDEPFFLDSEHNRKLLAKKLAERFPGSSFVKFESYKAYMREDFKITRAKANIDFCSIESRQSC